MIAAAIASFARGRRSSGSCDRQRCRRGRRRRAPVTHPLLASAVYQRSRGLGVASCTRGSRRSSAIRRNEPATWPCPWRARTSPSPPPSRRPRCWPPPGERRNPRPSSGRWLAAPRRGIEARTWCVGPTRRAWRTTRAGTPRWRGASWSKRWTSTAGPARARVLLDLGMGLAETEGWRGAWAVFEAARGEAGDDLALRARVEQNLGYAWLFRGDLAASERHARAALQLAEELQEPRVMAEAFQAYPFVEFLLGRGVDQEMLDRGIALEGHMEGEFKSHVLRASFVVAQLLKFTDRLDEARGMFTELLGDAAAHGVETPIAQIRYHLAELECRAGNWDAAMEHARESRRPPAATASGPCRRRATSRWAWWKPIWGGPTRRGRKPSRGCGSPRRPARSSS